jgi:hypothetical protein
VTSENVMTGLLVLAGLVLAFTWTAGARAGRVAERSVREVTRLTGNAARAVGAGAVIVGVQWATIATTEHPAAVGVALGVPALFAGSTVARLLAVTQVIRTLPPGSRR